MSTLGLFPRSFIISGLIDCKISKLNFAAFLSLILIFFLSFKFPSSFKTSWGTIHSIGSSKSSFATSAKSIFCFTQVRMKFVSSSIFMLLGV